MPQFAQVDTFASQIFWLVVSFAILFILLSKVVIPRISSVLESRQQKISSDLKRAEEARAEAEAALAEYRKALDASRAEAQALLRAEGEKLAQAQSKRLDKVNEEIAAKIVDAEKRIAAAKEQAMAGLKDVASEAAEAALEKLAGISTDKRTLNAALNAAVKQQGA